MTKTQLQCGDVLLPEMHSKLPLVTSMAHHDLTASSRARRSSCRPSSSSSSAATAAGCSRRCFGAAAICAIVSPAISTSTCSGSTHRSRRLVGLGQAIDKS